MGADVPAVVEVEAAVPSFQQLGELGASAVAGAGHEVAGELPVEALEAAPQGVSLARGQTKGIGQVSAAEAVPELEVEQGPVAQGELGDRFPQQRAQPRPPGVGVRERRPPAAGRCQLGPSRPLAPGDGEEPHGEAVGLGQPVQPEPRLEERGLDHVQRSALIAQHGQGEVVDASRVPVEDRRKGGGATGARSLDKLGVVHRIDKSNGDAVRPEGHGYLAGVATLPELARLHTRLNGEELSHLTRLVASWGILADLCFADLLLFVPVVGGDGRFIVLGQVRPTTSQTLHTDDLVGRIIDEAERPLVARAFRAGEIMDGEVAVTSRGGEPARLQCIPVRHRGELVGVLTREAPLTVGRRPGELERSYIEVFERLARMLVAGRFPYPVDEGTTAESPRVGDGVLLLDETARVVYASPNAVNALHRMGVYSNAEGVRLDELGVEGNAISEAWDASLPVTEELERRPDVIVLLRVLPLLDGRVPSGDRVADDPMGRAEDPWRNPDQPRVTGALVLLRDVSDVRRRDRLLLSKDATIREVHHRVKNNLQTIGSLLRLQARRLPPGEGRDALAEAERRIRSIALVHEILSREAGEQVPFDQIVAFLVRMAEDTTVSPDAGVCFEVDGAAGELPASLATPLAVVLSELLQNAVEHGYPEGSPGGTVCVELDNDGTFLHIVVRDDGRGLPSGFTIDRTRSLGLSIARDLVTSQMAGTIALTSATPAG